MWFTPSNSIADSSRDPDPPYCPARDPGRCPLGAGDEFRAWPQSDSAAGELGVVQFKEAIMSDTMSTAAVPAVADRATWQAQLDDLLVREKARTREGDAIAAARRRLPMVEVDAAIPVTGEHRAGSRRASSR